MLRRHRTQQDLLRTFWMDLGWGCIFYRQSDKSQGSLMSAGQMKHVPELGTGAGLMRSFLIEVADGFHSTRREKDCEGRSPIGMIYSDHDIEKWKAPSRRTIQQHMVNVSFKGVSPALSYPSQILSNLSDTSSIRT